jgi:glutaredoxin
MTKAVIWSKDACPFCVQAKALLESRGIEFEERNVSADWTREQLLEAVPTARTLPQIFIDDKLIGGFTELKKHFEKV